MVTSPGQELCAAFYRDVVAPSVQVPHAAALVGEGSEVLGYDDQRSTDHSWGPRLHLFVDEAVVEDVSRRIEQHLPETYRSAPVRFYAWQDQQVRHHVTVTTVASWLPSELRTSWPITAPHSWLRLSQQRLLQVTAGPVFHDGVGDLTRARQELAYFPDDIWWWMQASQWQLIADVEPLPGRLTEAGERRGSRLCCHRLATIAMQLTFLHARRYQPYAKWFATAFERLDLAADVGSRVDALLDASSGDRQAAALVDLLETLGTNHNTVSPGEVIDPRCQPFEVGINGARRPYQVLNAERYVRACQARIADPGLRRLAPVGGLDQLTHASDLLINFTEWPDRLGGDYLSLLDPSR